MDTFKESNSHWPADLMASLEAATSPHTTTSATSLGNAIQAFFTKLKSKQALPMFCPLASTSSLYSQVVVHGTFPPRKVTAHLMAWVYRMRFLEPPTSALGVRTLKKMLSVTGSLRNQASHVVANYPGSTHDMNPWNITLEPGDVNQGRRNCTLVWALNVAKGKAPTTTPERWVHDGVRMPSLPLCTAAAKEEFCHCPLHIPHCMAYLGKIPPYIAQRVKVKDGGITKASDLARAKRIRMRVKAMKDDELAQQQKKKKDKKVVGADES